MKEAVERLALANGFKVLDGTFGDGGHSAAILEKIRPDGLLIGLDQDAEAIERGNRRFERQKDIILIQENFRNADIVLDRLNIGFLDAVILDVGISSVQLDSGERGFSFEHDGPLDMRMNRDQGPSAADLVQDLSRQELERIFFEYGEEPKARRFAAMIEEARRTRQIRSTADLAEVIERALPPGLRFKKGHRPSWARRHPATRVFQALRIAVNDELGALREALPKLWGRLKMGGRMAVISFHSLEDRIVKHQFREWCRSGGGRLIDKKPVTASEEEVADNSRARSAKLRVIAKDDSVRG